MEYKFKVPEDCELIVTREGTIAIIEVVPREPEFKYNDIVYTEFNNHPCISIIQDTSSNYNSIKTKCSYNIYKCELDTNVIYTYDTIRLATDSEKQLLFDKLKEKCLMFDGENVVRWRAKRIGHYYFINYNMNVEKTFDCNHEIDRGRCKIGNYFPTEDIAEQFKKQYIDLLNNFHKNL